MHIDNPRRFSRKNRHLRVIRAGMGDTSSGSSGSSDWVGAVANAFTANKNTEQSGAKTAYGGGADTSAAGGGGGGGMPGYGAPTSSTAVSPTIQTQISPQISPTFIQSSGGGTQSGSAVQYQPGGQSGQGGSAGLPFPPSTTAPNNLLTGAPMPVVGAGTPQYSGVPNFNPNLVQSGPNWLLIGIGALVLGAVAYSLYHARK